MRSSVCASTRRIYLMRVRQMRELDLRCNYKGLRNLFGRFRDGRGSSELRQFLYAVEWHRDCKEKKPLSRGKEKRPKRLLKGRRYLCAVALPRGAILWDQLRDLLQWMTSRNAPVAELEDMLIVWGTGLRTSQLAGLTADKFSIRQHAVVLTIDKIHDPQRNMRDRALVETRVCHPYVAALLATRLESRRAADGRLALVCPEWVSALANAWVQQGARALGWTRNLCWDGAHCLRHGVAAEVMPQGVDAVQAVLGQASVSCALHYGRSNAERLAMRRRERKRRGRRGD